MISRHEIIAQFVNNLRDCEGRWPIPTWMVSFFLEIANGKSPEGMIECLADISSDWTPEEQFPSWFNFLLIDFVNDLRNCETVKAIAPAAQEHRKQIDTETASQPRTPNALPDNSLATQDRGIPRTPGNTTTEEEPDRRVGAIVRDHFTEFPRPFGQDLAIAAVLKIEPAWAKFPNQLRDRVRSTCHALANEGKLKVVSHGDEWPTMWECVAGATARVPKSEMMSVWGSVAEAAKSLPEPFSLNQARAVALRKYPYLDKPNFANASASAWYAMQSKLLMIVDEDKPAGDRLYRLRRDGEQWPPNTESGTDAEGDSANKPAEDFREGRDARIMAAV